LYPLYALFFSESGLSALQISVLLAIWSAVGIIAEIPAGALADRFSRRSCLISSGLLQAVAYAVWLVAPTFAGFAIGFVIWGIGGVLASGAREALLYDGLAAAGQAERYATVSGWMVSLGLLAEIPTALLAGLLFSIGQFQVVGWVSVGICLISALVAGAIPEAPRASGRGDDGDDLGYVAIIQSALRVAGRRPGVLVLIIIAAGLASLDAIEEYFPLIVVDLHIPISLVPLSLIPVALAGAAGAALAGRIQKLPLTVLAALVGSSMLLLAAVNFVQHPAGVAALALFYGCYRAVVVVLDARLQHRIESSSRATVTSFTAMLVDLLTFAVYGAWILGGVLVIALIGLVLAVSMAVILRASWERPIGPDC
jgi:MFS family permease